MPNLRLPRSSVLIPCSPSSKSRHSKGLKLHVCLSMSATTVTSLGLSGSGRGPWACRLLNSPESGSPEVSSCGCPTITSEGNHRYFCERGGKHSSASEARVTSVQTQVHFEALRLSTCTNGSTSRTTLWGSSESKPLLHLGHCNAMPPLR